MMVVSFPTTNARQRREAPVEQAAATRAKRSQSEANWGGGPRTPNSTSVDEPFPSSVKSPSSKDWCLSSNPDGFFSHVHSSGWTFDLICKYKFSQPAGSDVGVSPKEARQWTSDEALPVGDRSVGSWEHTPPSFALLGVQEMLESQPPSDDPVVDGRHPPPTKRNGFTLLTWTTGNLRYILGTHHEALDNSCGKLWCVQAVGRDVSCTTARDSRK